MLFNISKKRLKKMSRIDILPPLLTRIGFNEIDIKVYSATLGLGKVTIGE